MSRCLCMDQNRGCEIQLECIILFCFSFLFFLVRLESVSVGVLWIIKVFQIRDDLFRYS